MHSHTPFITDSIIHATEWLKAGRLLAYPTESVWGIGCDPFNEAAVRQLLAIKQRPIEKGMIIVTDRVERITPLLDPLNAKQRHMILDSWQPSASQRSPQAHTWLLPLSEQLSVPIPSWITGAHSSVAVRVINHPIVQQLCAQLVSATNPYGFIVSTSCNLSGHLPALSLDQAQAYFVNSDFSKDVGYLQGDTLGYQLPSQIHNALTGQIIR